MSPNLELFVVTLVSICHIVTCNHGAPWTRPIGKVWVAVKRELDAEAATSQTPAGPPASC